MVDRQGVTKRWVFPICAFLATSFGVFVLPFLLPPPPLAGVSAANIAGFNNKVAAVVAAVMGLVVYAVSVRWFRRDLCEESCEHGRLPRPLIFATVAVSVGFIALVSHPVMSAHLRYLGDAGYFVEQISKHADYGRKLYDEIEFPYGPLIFYGPIAVRALLSPFHVSLMGAYLITLVLEHAGGLLLVAYVIDRLPILIRWKTLFFLLCGTGVLEFSFGLNYTMFRFIVPAALVVALAQQRRPLAAAIWAFAGEFVCLAVSPEMGFAFGAGSLVYAIYLMKGKGKAWLAALAAPLLATGSFLLVTGGAYLRMLKLFANGVYNFIVQPLPHIVVFLFALVWLVPCALAAIYRQRRKEFPMLMALYVIGLALLPVAFGRADPTHVFFNGIAIYLLSMVAISTYRRNEQIAWAVCVSCVLLWTAYVNIRFFDFETKQLLRATAQGLTHDGMRREAVVTVSRISAPGARYLRKLWSEKKAPFDMARLKEIVGDAPVVTPYPVQLEIEEDLKRSGQYAPTFYCFQVAVLDQKAEEREIRELNAMQWALLPGGLEDPSTETTESMASAVGFKLPYRNIRTPYYTGSLFQKNLREHWQPYGNVGEYVVYRRRQNDAVTLLR